MEEDFWKLCSRISWCNEGDDTTRFFHSMTTNRKRVNSILYFKDENGKDLMSWDMNSNGMFITKSCYKLLEDNHWDLHCPTKIKFFIWQCMHNKIPCRTYLHYIGINIDPICPICKQGHEDATHIFLLCPIAIRYWSSIGLIINRSNAQSNWLAILRNSHLQDSHHHYAWKNILPFSIWNLWKNRNNNVNNLDVDINPSQERPLPNKIKLNIDGAFLKEKLHAGIERVFRNSSGKWIMGFTKYCYITCSLQAELLALEQGLKLAVEMPYTVIEIESDSTDIIKMLMDENASTNACLLNYRSLMHRLKSTVIRHNFREGNVVADCLAKEVVKDFKLDKCYHLARPPLFVEAILEKDMQGLCFGIKQLSTSVCNSLVTLNNSNVLRDYVTSV
ncbi:uncharacterized protein LOC142175508 [Nicotiana tabacum]|uniref:Uncharacterized protein LOC142175508 n=1 Tax=Nicotiana tabacum TaxID=4097 RepID=A0AC58TMQ9_TOBAC